MAKNYDEKECEICGVWFTPHTANTKYCPECRNHSDQKRRNLEKQVSRNIQIYGIGIKKKNLSSVPVRIVERNFLHIARIRTFAVTSVRLNTVLNIHFAPTVRSL